MTILKDIIEKEPSREVAEFNAAPRTSGFPKAKSSYSRKSGVTQRDVSLNIALGENGPVLNVSPEDLQRLEWTNQYEEQPTGSNGDYSDSDIIQLLQSSFPGQRVIALSQLRDMTDERVISLVDSFTLHLRLSVCCSSSSMQVRLSSWTLLDRLCGLSAKARQDLASIPEFIQTIINSFTSPPIACSALTVLSHLSPYIDESLIESVSSGLESEVLDLVLQPSASTNLVCAYLKNSEFVSEDVLEPVCIAAISSFLFPYIYSPPVEGNPDACAEALEIWNSGKALPENIRAFAPAISAFFASGISSISPKLIRLLSIFREIFGSAVDDCLHSLLPHLKEPTVNAMKAAAALVDFFPGVEISRFAEAVWDLHGLNDAEGISICARALPDHVITANVAPRLMDLEISSQLVPLAARVAALTGNRTLAIQVLKKSEPSKFDLSPIWKFLNFPNFSGTPEEVIETEIESSLAPFFNESIFREIFVDRLTFFRAICSRVVKSGDFTDLEILSLAFDSLSVSDSACGPEWLILGFRVLEFFSETGHTSAAWATFALVSKIFPTELRATIFTDCEMLLNFSKVVSRPMFFTSSLEFPGFDGPERQQVRSRLREFLVECPDGAVADVARLILDN